MKQSGKQSGFTFIELCMVTTLISLLLLLTLPPMVLLREKQQSQQFISQLSSDLQYISILARTQQTIYYLELLPYQGIYWIHSPFGLLQKKESIPVGIQVSSNFNKNHISYNASGQISQGGTIYIKDQRGKNYQFVVQLSSGRFRISYGP